MRKLVVLMSVLLVVSFGVSVYLAYTIEQIKKDKPNMELPITHDGSFETKYTKMYQVSSKGEIVSDMTPVNVVLTYDDDNKTMELFNVYTSSRIYDFEKVVVEEVYMGKSTRKRITSLRGHDKVADRYFSIRMSETKGMFSVIYADGNSLMFLK